MGGFISCPPPRRAGTRPPHPCLPAPSSWLSGPIWPGHLGWGQLGSLYASAFPALLPSGAPRAPIPCRA